MLRCVDIPNNHRKSDGTHSTTYDRVDNDSEGYYGKSSDYDSPKSSVLCDSTPSVSEVGITPKHTSATPEISKRPPMKTPELSSSSSSDDDDDDGGDEFPSSGTELMRAIENRMKSRDNRAHVSSVPLSDDFSRKKTPKPEPIVPTLPVKIKHHKRRVIKSIEYSSDEDYDYTSINDLPRPLERMPVPSKHRKSALSPECFQSLKVKIVDAIDNPLGLGSQFEWKTYLSSAAVFGQFTESFYDWSQKLDRNLQDASAYKAAICCPLIKPASNCQYRTTVEFVPVIPVAQWPDIAREWKTRKRTPVLDNRTNIEYRWPQPTQMETIIKQGCHLITEGGKFRGHTSANAKLQWQLSFGAAHETLLSSLSEPHLRALLWCRLIFHHVVAPLGVLSQYHLETIFFWQIESNYANWNEHSLGENIMAIFKVLYDSIQQRKLPHYFIRKRNLLSTRAPKDLVKAQGRLFRLTERFVPLVLETAKQLQTSNSTFPFPDLARMWEIATTKLTIDSINPALGGPTRHLSSSEGSLNGTKKKKASSRSGDEGFWETMTSGDKTRDLLRKERARIDAEEREKRPVTVAEPVEKMDTQITAFNISQRKLLLELFIDHFIQMVKSCNKIRDYRKSTVFLDQAFNLSILLREEGYDDLANARLDVIEHLRNASRQGQFTEAMVNIPGSPCVFPTGVEQPTGRPLSGSYGVQRNNSLSNGSILSTPLPLTPVERSFLSKAKNGQVKPKSSFSHEQDFLNGPIIPTLHETLAISSNAKSTITTAAVIESVRSSEAEPTDQFDTPPIIHRVINITTITTASQQSDVDMDESTDF